MLNHKTMTLLANTLAPKVAKAIGESEEFVEFMMEHIPPAIDAELGECDDDLFFELGMMVMERMLLKGEPFGG